MPSKPLLFDPAMLSLEELNFLLVHLGEPTTVAVSDIDTRKTPGVHPDAIRTFLTLVNDLEDMRLHKGIPWAGFDLVKDAITRYLLWDERAREIYRRGGPRHPSMHNWDSTGRIYRGGTGADSSEMVRSEILNDGTRKPFRVNLREATANPEAKAVMPWLDVQPSTPTVDTVAHDETSCTLTCSICGKAVSYNKKSGKAAFNRARGHMARHLSTSREELQRHRVLYAKEFR